jgi:CheY-like chemotaxis protein
VGLNGSLEEFSIQDILQILALGQKTGHLSVDTPAGAGAIVFRAGRIVASFDGGSPSLETSLASWSECPRDAVIRRRIVACLDRLDRARRGSFHFQVSADPPLRVQGRDIARETLQSGMDVVELLLEMAWRRDEDARDASDRPVRTTTAPAAPSVLLVDDEDLVRRLLARYLVEGGYRVVEAGDVESAVECGASLGEAGVRFVLVADLNMPASAGDSFRGGVEVVKRLAKLRLRPPVVMMADGAPPSLGAKPIRGVWSLVQKPGLSKLDPKEFEADVRALAGRMVQDVLPRVCGAVTA